MQQETMNITDKKRIVVGISGASAAPIALRVLELLKNSKQCEIHLVLSSGGERLLKTEYGEDGVEKALSFADYVYDNTNTGASIASGSFSTSGMIVVPCSMKTLACIRMGLADSLLLRAADVTIKERRLLVLVPRETPLSPIHLDNMLTLSRLGVHMLPPVLGFYYKPETIDDMVNQIACKIVAPFIGEVNGYKHWLGDE